MLKFSLNAALILMQVGHSSLGPTLARQVGLKPRFEGLGDVGAVESLILACSQIGSTYENQTKTNTKTSATTHIRHLP